MKLKLSTRAVRIREEAHAHGSVRLSPKRQFTHVALNLLTVHCTTRYVRHQQNSITTKLSTMCPERCSLIVTSANMNVLRSTCSCLKDHSTQHDPHCTSPISSSCDHEGVRYHLESLKPAQSSHQSCCKHCTSQHSQQTRKGGHVSEVSLATMWNLRLKHGPKYGQRAFTRGPQWST